MSFTLSCIHVKQAASLGASSSWINFINSVGLESLVSQISGVGLITRANFSNYQKNAYKDIINMFRDGTQCGDIIQGWAQPVFQTVCLQFNTQADEDYYDNNLVGRELEINLLGYASLNGASSRFPIFYFKNVLPSRNNQKYLYIDSAVCITSLPTFSQGEAFSSVAGDNQNTNTIPVYGYNSEWSENEKYLNNFIKLSANGGDTPDDCVDKRSSDSTSEFLITLNGRNIELNQESVHYNLLIQPDTQHTSGEITLSSADGLYSSFYKYDGASVRMLDNTCCHGTGYIDIYGDVEIIGWGISEVADVLIPVPRSLSRQNVLLLRAIFDDECCCYATGYADEITDLINDFMGGYSEYDSKTEILSAITPKKISWNGFERLTEFCCDDSDCTDTEDYEYRIEIPEPSTGGGDSVDISCICDNLSLINNTLSAFRSDNKIALDSINSTLSQLNIDFDNECICDNLESIKGSIDGVKGSIDDKELSVINNNTVQPPVNNVLVQPPVNNVSVEPPVNNVSVQPPVNNVSVQPPVNNVSVQPCSPVITNPVNNITVQPSQIDVQDIVDKMEELFKTDDKSITDVIKDKDMGSNIDVEVSPADDVNINRVYYTNQKNGDTNI